VTLHAKSFIGSSIETTCVPAFGRARVIQTHLLPKSIFRILNFLWSVRSQRAATSAKQKPLIG